MDITSNSEKQKFAERLNHALDIYGTPPKGKGRQLIVAKMFGVSQKGASKWLEGKSFPGTDRLSTIAERLNVNFEWLITGKGHINIESLPSPGKTSMKRVPMLSWKDAPHWKKISFNEGIRWAWADADVGPYAFAVEVIDDSMVPRYNIGSILIIDPESKPEHRTIVLVQKNTGEIMCRQLLVDNNKRYLKPDNIKYPALLIDEKKPQIEIIGAARQVFMEV